ncbi:MAG: hypothetical protein HKN87_01435 [Saprospiraceae bacterium]|nr:hypothetical protein [Saprospiraceae bacterium]
MTRWVLPIFDPYGIGYGGYVRFCARGDWFCWLLGCVYLHDQVGLTLITSLWDQLFNRLMLGIFQLDHFDILRTYGTRWLWGSASDVELVSDWNPNMGLKPPLILTFPYLRLPDYEIKK